MKIISLTAENIKKLRAVEITPDGALVQITGKNGMGKSSILDAIWWALAGTDNIQAAPIRKGAERARIRLDLGELVVERRFSEAGSSLTVENAEGARYKSPQAMLDALLGALAFDPLGFVNEKPKDQFETLRGIAKLDVDFDNLTALSRGDFERRTLINRDAKALRAQADGITLAANVPAEKVDTAALMDRMAEASKVNAEIETRKGRREQAELRITQLRHAANAAMDQAASLRKQADEVEAGARQSDKEADELSTKLANADPLPEPVDVDELRLDLAAAEATNKQVEAKLRKADLIKQAVAKEAEAQGLTEAIEARDQVKADAIAKAEMPVPGLGFGEGIVTFNEVPFDQASTAEQIRVSVAIAMAANPKLRVIRIKEGSLLDEDGLALIAQMAADHDYQIWLERVDSSGKIGVVIDDGNVVAVDGVKTTPVDPVASAKPVKAKKAAKAQAEATL